MEKWELDADKENLEEHNNTSNTLQYHSAGSLINLYRDLLKLTNKLMKELEEK